MSEPACSNLVPRLNLRTSHLRFLDRFLNKYREILKLGPAGAVERFGCMPAPLINRVVSRDLRRVCSGWVYWTYYLKGYADYLEAGDVSDHNSYFTCLPIIFAKKTFDAKLGPLVDDPRERQNLVRERYRVGDYFASGAMDFIDPVVVIGGHQNDIDFQLYDMDGRAVQCSALDGIHRLFWAVFHGLESFPYLLAERAEDIQARTIAYLEAKNNKCVYDYCRLGGDYFKRGEYAESKAYFEKAVAMAEEYIRAVRPDLACKEISGNDRARS